MLLFYESEVQSNYYEKFCSVALTWRVKLQEFVPTKNHPKSKLQCTDASRLWDEINVRLLETFTNEDDYEYEIFSILSGACA